MVKTLQENKRTDSLLGSGEGVPGAICCRREMWALIATPTPALEECEEEKGPLHRQNMLPQARPCAWDKGHTRPSPPATKAHLPPGLPLTSWSGCPALELTSSGLLLMAELGEALIPSYPVRLGNRELKGGALAEVTGRDEPKGGNEGGPDVMRVGFPVSSLLPQFECLAFYFQICLKGQDF